MKQIDAKHAQQFPLPRTDFLYDREGPWPQPAPDHPMGMAAEVLHPAKAEERDWSRTAGWNYKKTMLLKLPLAFWNWFVHHRIDHISDEEFVWLMTTTTYSKYLRLRSVEQLTSTHFAELRDQLEPGREYLTMDFSPMQDLEPYPGMYVAPTIALFRREPQGGAFSILAISIGHLEGNCWKQIVLTPKDVNAWILAKYYVIQGAAHMVVLSGHPATHFPYDTVNAVTQSAMPTRHTLFKLLKPHLRLQLAVNNAVLEGAHSVVSETHGEFYAPFVGPSATIRQLVAAGYVGYPNVYSKYAPGDEPGPAYPEWLYPHGPRDIPSDFGRVLSAYYETVKSFVRKVVRVILDNPDRKLRDEEIYYIRCWADYIAYWIPGFKDGSQILEQDPNGDPWLVTAATSFIWDVSIAHSLDHRAFGFLGPHKTSFRVRVPPPSSRDVPYYRRSQILSGWDMFKSTLGFEMFFKPHNIQLLKDIEYEFDGEVLKAYAEEFKLALFATQEQLVKDGVDVQQYIPVDEIACSIQY